MEQAGRTAADRARASKARRRRGDVLMQAEISSASIARLVALGWLAEHSRTDRMAVTLATAALLREALSRGVAAGTSLGHRVLNP